ncbi:MAG: sigma-54-dependent Fis family transcriptional regulator [Acidobacteria bacterium]|nr:MAG: sigma-54-dependent Fis family transcriptional regulator [Acidobacteriota bacterium]
MTFRQTRRPLASAPSVQSGGNVSAQAHDSRFLGETAQRVRSLSVDAWGEGRAVEMVGTHPCFLDVLARLEKVACYDEPVLITGESGCGKELLAEALYLLGPRRGRPFIPVNCPQYQDGNLTVSELFGHTRGSFTGAIADRRGCFETGDGGVIFLDEIADLHMSAQVMLLRALATGEFQPLGADRRTSVNVRVVAATNRELGQLMVAKEFRHDLFFRLRYFFLTVPPLRQRGDDWILLLEYALQRLHRKYGVEKRFAPASLDVLSSYHWPGNVRQLISVATMGYALAEGATIQPADIADQLDRVRANPPESAEDLYQRVFIGRESFWSAIYDPFMRRDLNRSQVKAFVKKGLVDSQGSYQGLLQLLGVPQADYQKFMDFLRHQRLKPDTPPE